ncbi:MAG: caspase domain-containing protein [Pyrinomonadaceae bacterium]
MKVRLTLPLLVVGLLALALTPGTARSQQPGLGAGQAAPAAGDLYYALVIGNDEYIFLPKVGTAAKDARTVERVLRETYGFQTKLLIDATRSQIVAALSGYRRESSADASLLIYYAGHGYKDDKADRAYWLPVDTPLEDVSNWLGADEITTAVRLIPARHVLVVSDSCYSGTLPRALSASPSRPDERERFLQKMAAGRSRTLIASGGDEPVANDGDSSRSVFAAALLRGLREMEGPRFTASELFADYVLGPVAGRTGRIPVYNPLRNSGHESGDFVFKRIKPVDTCPGSCDDEEEKTKLYQRFLDFNRSNAEQQKVAYEVGKEYVSRYESCPKESDKNVIGYIRSWLGKYEAAVREFERSKGRRP